MARKRLRDWPQLVYKVDAYPQGDIPQELWDQAHAMQKLWNSCIELHQKTRDRVRDLPKDQAKPIWQVYQQDFYALIKKSGLGWEARDEIRDRFQTASRRAAKEGATLRPRF